MIRLLLPCPKTHRLVGTGEEVRAFPREEGIVHARHCPACSDLHRYRISDAVLQMAPGGAGAA